MKLSVKKVSFLDRFGEEKPKNGAFAAIPRIFLCFLLAPLHFPPALRGPVPRAKRQRMGQDKIDTQFLKDTVADVLVRACSECAVSQPKDPVGFVAGWLDQYVANDTILKKHEAAKQLAAEQEAAIEQVGGPLPF